MSQIQVLHENPAWLTRWGRRVVNGPGALDLEISKVRQYAVLERHGIATPRSVPVAGRGLIVAAAERHFGARPVILKPNRGGKGLGVRLFHTTASLVAYVDSDDYETPVDGVQLLQKYVRAPARLPPTWDANWPPCAQPREAPGGGDSSGFFTESVAGDSR